MREIERNNYTNEKQRNMIPENVNERERESEVCLTKRIKTE